MKGKLCFPICIAPGDSGYWVGTCWNLYQLTNDSCFRVEAERCMEKMQSIYEDSILTPERGLQLFLAFGRGFEVTGERRYKHEVWNLGDRLLEDTACITSKTVEALLWGTGYKGCHCLKEAAIKWSEQQNAPIMSVDDVMAFISLYQYTNSLKYLNVVLDIDEATLMCSTSDSIYLALGYSRMSELVDDKVLLERARNLLAHLNLFSIKSFFDSYYYTSILLELDIRRRN